MTEELKPLPCPWCGGTNLKSGGDDKWVGVGCLTCGAIGPNHYETGRDWNTRSPAWRSDLVPLPRDATKDMEQVMADTINEILRQLGRDELSNDDARWIAGAAWANGKEVFQPLPPEEGRG